VTKLGVQNFQNRFRFRAGLPDFSWENVPNDNQIYQNATKYTKMPQNIPKYHKIYQNTTKYTKIPQNISNGLKIYQQLLLQVPPKFTRIRIFWFENMLHIWQTFFKGKI
jgi:hypothetical protein